MQRHIHILCPDNDAAHQSRARVLDAACRHAGHRTTQTDQTGAEGASPPVAPGGSQARPSRCDVLLVVGWESIPATSDPDLPTVVDLPAPVLPGDPPEADHAARALAKIRALDRADLFLLATENDFPYFLPWMAMLGCDLRDPPLVVVDAAGRLPAPVARFLDAPRRRARSGSVADLSAELLRLEDLLKRMDHRIRNLEEHHAGPESGMP